MNFNPKDYRSRRFQEMILVLFALYEMGGSRTKEEVLRYVRFQGWMASTPQDHENYESKNETKSDTLLCFARLDDVKKGLMFHHDESDCWDITRMGQDFLENQKRLFNSEMQKICYCYMWTPKFKRIFDATYKPSETDWTVPSSGERNGGIMNLARKYIR